jgi:hypothetical protein
MKNFIIVILLSVLLFSCEGIISPLEDNPENPPNVFVHISGLSDGYRIGIEIYDNTHIVNVSNGEDFYLERGAYTVAVTLFKGKRALDSIVINSKEIDYLHKRIDETLFIKIENDYDLFVHQFEIAEETLLLKDF